MACKGDVEQKLSILFSLLYLRDELRSEGFERTQNLLGCASYTFFEDLESQVKLGADIARIRDFLEHIETMDPNMIEKALSLIEPYEPENDNARSKPKNQKA